MTHLIDDETVAKMGHPVEVVRSDVGHPPKLRLLLQNSLRQDDASDAAFVVKGHKVFFFI